MITRRGLLEAGVALAAIVSTPGIGGWGRLMAQQKLSEDDLLNFKPHGNVTLLHFADLHAQLNPVYYREPLQNFGSSQSLDKVPHITGSSFLKHFKIPPQSPMAYALTGLDFTALAQSYGRMGGLDRIARMVERIRAERPGACLLLDSGDSWQGSFTALHTKGADVIDVMEHLKPDAMTGHWEFTYGAARVSEAIKELSYAFLAGNVVDATWEEPVFPSTAFFERGGVKVAVIGQAFPYTPIANPRYMIPDWSFGIREELVQSHVHAARAKGAGLVVLLSHNGFDVDAKLASRVRGIDVILTGHTHDALPEVYQVGRTLLIASGANGKFLSRLDLDVTAGGVKGFSYRLIPVFSDVVEPWVKVRAAIDKVRAPFQKQLSQRLGSTDSLLYRRGTFNGTMDELILDALMQEMDAEIALSPGFRWGPSLLPGSDITLEDLYAATGITYPAVYRQEMTGSEIKVILEAVADNLFHEDPYYAQGGDMVRVGGLSYHITMNAKSGARISQLKTLNDGAPLDAGKRYRVAGWASVNEGVSGPPIYEVVEAYLKSLDGPVNIASNKVVRWE